MASRVYVVLDLENPARLPRLIDATYEHMAIRHASQNRFRAHIASKADLVKYMSAGAPIEYADRHRTETQQPLLPAEA